VTSVDFMPDGELLLAAHLDGKLAMWDVAEASLFGTLDTTDPREALGTWDARLSPDGQLIATAGEDRSVRIWGTKTGRCYLRLEGHSETVRSVGFSPNGRSLVSGGDDGTVRVWDLEAGVQKSQFDEHEGAVSAVAFRGDESVVSCGRDRSLRVWKIESPGPGGGGVSARVRPLGLFLGGDDSLSVARLSGGKLEIRDEGTGRILASIPEPGRDVKGVIFSREGHRIATYSSHGIRIWDLRAAICLASLSTHQLASFTFSSDWRRVATGHSHAGIHFYNAVSGERVHRMKAENYPSSVIWLCFSPDDRLLACSSGGGVHLYDSESYEHLQSLRVSGEHWGLGFSEDGTRLAVATLLPPDDQRISVLDLKTGNELESVRGFGDLRAIATTCRAGGVRAVENGAETVIEDVLTGRAHGWFYPMGGLLRAGNGEMVWGGRLWEFGVNSIRLEPSPRRSP
jgi:WD40 repeat protein